LPLLCPLADKERLEAENAVKMLDFIADLVIDRGAREVRESHVLELQRVAIQGIYPCAGKFRDARFDRPKDDEHLRLLGEGLRIGGSKHQPPDAAHIRGLTIDMLDVCNSPKLDAITRAAYALWRCNWIHPFAGGNGRVARALSYLIICMDIESMIPGTPTMPGLIAKARERYLAALREVDENIAQIAGDPTEHDPALNFLQPMRRFVGAMLTAQLRAAKLSRVAGPPAS
jgi:Fic family protein